jgi:hypothetical protein
MNGHALEAVNGKILTALTNVAQAVGPADALLAAISYSNPNAAAVWLQFFAEAPANVTVGTTPPSCAIALEASFSGHTLIDITGASFNGPVSVAATTTPTGSTAPGTAITACVFVR